MIKNYKINKVIIRSAFLIIIIYFMILFFTNKPYIVNTCPADSLSKCDNVLYRADCFEDYCKDKYIDQGITYTSGTPPNFFAKNFLSLSLLILIVAYGINHLIYNVGFRNGKL